MPVHVPVVLSVTTFRIVDQTVGLAAAHEPVDGAANVVVVLSFADRATFHEQRHAAQCGHDDRGLASVGLPVAVGVLMAGKPLQSFGNGCPVFSRYLFSASWSRQRRPEHEDSNHH